MQADHEDSIQQYEERLVSIHDLVESKDLSTVVDSADEVERLKAKLAEFAKLSEVLENDRLAKNSEIEKLREQLLRFEGWEQEKQVYEEKQKLLEDAIEMERKLKEERYSSERNASCCSFCQLLIFIIHLIDIYL